jgi:hypothetical protein
MSAASSAKWNLHALQPNSRAREAKRGGNRADHFIVNVCVANVIPWLDTGLVLARIRSQSAKHELQPMIPQPNPRDHTQDAESARPDDPDATESAVNTAVLKNTRTYRTFEQRRMKTAMITDGTKETPQ